MATTCRICHPEQFDTKDPDPQYIHVDDEDEKLETSYCDDENNKKSGTASFDGDHDEDNSSKTKGLNDKEEKKKAQHLTLKLGQNNDSGLNSGNDSDHSDETSVYTRNKRETHWNSRRGSGEYKGSHKPKTNKGKRLMSRVLMPNKKYNVIMNVVRPHWKCGDHTKLIYLGPNSRIGKREFNIVEAAMQETIVHDDNCESGGKCFDQYTIIKIQKILQGCAWRKYQARKTNVALEAGHPNEKMLFHGTDAVRDIVSGGFDERFTSTNGQFGAGLYFAQNSSLANQFVFGYFGGNGCKRHHDKDCYICERQLLLCRVTLGKPYQLKTIQNMPHPPPGYHSVEAIAGKGAFQHPEFVIYRGEQAYPEYLITYKIVEPKKDNHDDQDSKWLDRDNNKSGSLGSAEPTEDNAAPPTRPRGSTSQQGRYPCPGVKNWNNEDRHNSTRSYYGYDSVIGPSQRPTNVEFPRIDVRHQNLDYPRGGGRGNSNSWSYRDRGSNGRYDSKSYRQI